MLLLLLACTDRAPIDDTAGTADTGADVDTDIDPRFAALAAAIEDDIAANSASGASVAVYQGGQIVFARGFGSGHPSEEQPITPTTLFQIGSTTKMFTATALLQKVESGALSLEDTLADALPELEYVLDDTWNDQIRLHHLLSQSSGLCDYVPWDGASDDSDLAGFSYGEYATYLYAMNPAGQFWNYSNPNFSLAGLATQNADTRMWPDLVLEDVLEPLGMARATARKSDVEADGDYATGYGLRNLTTGAMGTVPMDKVVDPAWVRPAGMIWATPTDMLQMATFLMDGDSAVLSNELRALLTTEHVSLAQLPGVQAYGYGVFVDRGFFLGADWYEVPAWSHGGNTLSFTSTFHVLPEQDFAISILSNGYGDDFSGSVRAAFESLVDLPAPSTTPPDFTFDSEGLDAHVGAYLDEYNVGDVYVSRKGDVLYVDMPALDAAGFTYDHALTPVSTDLWIFDLGGTRLDLTFLDGTDGTPSQFIRNRSFVMTRVPGDAPPAPPASTARPVRGGTPEQLAAWIARLRLQPSELATSLARPR